MTIYQNFLRSSLAAIGALALIACSGSHNWRDYSSPDAPYRVMFPDKPSVHKRSIDLDGMKVEMTMTAVDDNGTIYAVGSAEAPDANRASAALGAMKTALVRNIGATVTSEKARASSSTSTGQQSAIDVEASGTQNGTPMKLVGHFEARDTRFYQVIVMGKDKAMPKEQVEQFISSFKLQ
ncbi:MAG: hypothetical protein JWP59_3730 [Massilia sp.]|nr:hypothetical protein [Massilia sp.]